MQVRILRAISPNFNKFKGETMKTFTVLTAIWIIIGIIISLWTDRNLDFVCSFIAGRAVDVPYWLSLCASIVFSGFIFMFNVFCEILRLVI